ncbi:MAG TPA: hypothetical protein VFK03_00350 [Candidatus Saccharimonadales bacterium]|nr:hypothetical protein [Candidatus Saccharimonadales bacterium]
MGNSTTDSSSVRHRARKSELDKFKLYFETDMTTKQIRNDLKRS